MAKNSNSFSPQIYFNWGFGDAAADVRAGRPNKWAGNLHPNNNYRQGYLAGWADAEAGNDTEDSQEAWDLAKFWELV